MFDAQVSQNLALMLLGKEIELTSEERWTSSVNGFVQPALCDCSALHDLSLEFFFLPQLSSLKLELYFQDSIVKELQIRF